MAFVLPFENELIRIQILFELYKHLFVICDYESIQRQEYKISCEMRCEIIANLYYLNDRGSITVRTTDKKDVFIIFIRARGIDEIEDRIRRTTFHAHAFSIGCLLIPEFEKVYEDYNNNNKDSK